MIGFFYLNNTNNTKFIYNLAYEFSKDYFVNFINTYFLLI